MPLLTHPLYPEVFLLMSKSTQLLESLLTLLRTGVCFLKGLWGFRWASLLWSRKIFTRILQLQIAVNLPSLELQFLSYKDERLYHLTTFQLQHLKFALMTNAITLCTAELLSWFFPIHLQENFPLNQRVVKVLRVTLSPDGSSCVRSWQGTLNTSISSWIKCFGLTARPHLTGEFLCVRGLHVGCNAHPMN